MKRVFLKALPQSITLGGAFFGFLAMIWASDRTYAACVAILAASVCDMIDGRVARLTGTQSAFGAQLDSLADIVSFGAAPAFLIYVWGIGGADAGTEFDPALLLVFLFTSCSALRLARFNLGNEEQPKFHMIGLPTPMAALFPTTLVMAYYEIDLEWLRNSALLIAVLLVVGLLMVSRVPFPSYKRFRSRRRQIGYFLAVIGGWVLLAVGGPGGTVLLVLILVYFGQTIWDAVNRARATGPPSH